MFPKIDKKNLKCNALPPLNIFPIKLAQIHQQQGGCFNQHINKKHNKPTHQPQKQQERKCNPPLWLNIVKIKPVQHPRQQQHCKHPDMLLPSKSKAPTVLPSINEKAQRPVVPVIMNKKEKLPELVITKHNKLLEPDHFPLTPTDVLNRFGKMMTKHERGEILYYTEIWYLGLIAKKGSRSRTSEQNKTRALHDHIAYRYEVLEMIEKGTYGQVYKCQDHKTSEMVAIKVIQPNNVMVNELKILEFLRKKNKDNCHNIIQMKDHFYFRGQLCIVFELLGPNLYELMKKNRFKCLSLAQVRQIAKELLKCMSILEQEKIIHTDLKPENIVLEPTKKNGIKVIDFGLSCFEHLQEFAYVGTLPYCAPEVLVHKRYTTAIDMWSLGCTLCELYTGQPLFFGVDEVDQMSCIMEVLGNPPADFVTSRRKLFFDCTGEPITKKDSMGRPRVPGSLNLADTLCTYDKLFLDFIKRCLTWDPKVRLTAKEALQHKWILQSPL